MRSNMEFEALVFERAELIKQRDRKNKMIRMSVMPIAAAFLVLTAVGIRNFIQMPYNATAMYDNAAGQTDHFEGANAYKSNLYDSLSEEPTAENNTSVNNELKHESIIGSNTEANKEYDVADNYSEVFDDDSIETFDRPIEQDGKLPPEDNEISGQVIFKAQKTIIVSDINDVKIITSAIKELDKIADTHNTVCLGDITLSTEQGTDYKIFNDHIEIFTDGKLRDAYELTDKAKTLLSGYFPLSFKNQ